MNCQEGKQQGIGNFEECLKCIVCTAYCPVTAVNPVYPGPKLSGPDGERYRLKDGSFYDEALKYCLNCKRCEVACPSGVNVADIIQSARIKHNAHKPSLRDRILSNTDMMGSMAVVAAPAVNTLLGLRPVKAALDGMLAIDSRRTMPAYSTQRFTTWFRRYAAANQEAYQHKVGYFHGCYVQYNNPVQGRAFVKLMNAVGYGVKLLDRERCCGVAKVANGLIDQARHDAVINTEAIRRAVAEGRDVVATSSTCTLTMRNEYPILLGVDNADVRENINLAVRFLYQLVEEKGVKLAFRNDYRRRVAYHTPCHMARLGWAIYPISLLRMVPGVELTVLDQECCGMAGTFGFKKENYAYSQAIGGKLFDSIVAANPELVATDCETCRWQIEMSTSYSVESPIVILADALDEEATCRLNGVPYPTTLQSK